MPSVLGVQYHYHLFISLQRFFIRSFTKTSSLLGHRETVVAIEIANLYGSSLRNAYCGRFELDNRIQRLV